MKATVFSIEEFATFDGPGIRETVFLKGCPLSCAWCHNPEGQNPHPEYMRSPNGCVGCKACERLARKTENELELTEESAKACPKSLIKTCGTEYEAEELVQKLLKNERVLNMNGGGVTFSGGEPLYSYRFLTECLTLLEGRLHRAIQTTGYCASTRFESVLQKVDYVLYDLKLMDGEAHKRWCGVDNAVIKKNYEILAGSGVDFITRIPLIPSVTDTIENLTAIAEFMQGLGVKEVEVLPYNRLAGAKYGGLLRKYAPDFNQNGKINDGKEIFEGLNVKHTVM